MTNSQVISKFFAWKGGEVTYPEDDCDMIVNITGEPPLRVHVVEGWEETDSGFKVPPLSDKTHIDDTVLCLVKGSEIIIIHQAALSEDGTEAEQYETNLWLIKEHGVDYLLKRDARIYQKL